MEAGERTDIRVSPCLPGISPTVDAVDGALVFCEPRGAMGRHLSHENVKESPGAKFALLRRGVFFFFFGLGTRVRQSNEL